MSKLIKKQKAIRAAKTLHARTLAQLGKAVVWFTASAAGAKIVRSDHPMFLARIDPDVGDYYKGAELPWSMCAVILDYDPVSKQFALDEYQYQDFGDYETIMESVFLATQEVLDGMNPRRRKNIALFARVGDQEFTEKEIERLISVDTGFYESEGLITAKESRQADKLALAAKLEALVD